MNDPMYACMQLPDGMDAGASGRMLEFGPNLATIELQADALIRGAKAVVESAQHRSRVLRIPPGQREASCFCITQPLIHCPTCKGLWLDGEIACQHEGAINGNVCSVRPDTVTLRVGHQEFHVKVPTGV